MENNKYKLELRGSQMLFSECDMFGDKYKKLQTGLGFFFAVNGGKSFDIDCSQIIIKPSDNQNYIYAKLPVSGGNAKMIYSTNPLSDDVDNYYILLTSGTYSQLNLK